jgi:hypothetical protein
VDRPGSIGVPRSGAEGRGGERKVGPGTQWFVGECDRVHVARLSPEPYPVKCELPSTCLADGSYCSNVDCIGRRKVLKFCWLFLKPTKIIKDDESFCFSCSGGDVSGSMMQTTA